ncbi:MAG: IS256 family transposase [Chloroflexi bacterium]|nr:IS256 family transposase [Chloroflexota bacterium]
MDPLAFLRKVVEDGDPDLLRGMVRTFAETLMSAEASALAGAAYGERSPERSTQRNGYRARRWDTRSGSIDLGIPKLRAGSYFPDWLLEPRRRAERALTAVVAQAYVEGISTRRVDDLVRALGIEGLSKSTVSEMAASLDEGVRAFRERPLDQGPYRHLWLGALAIRVREAGRIVSVWAVVATAVNRDGQREILGLDVFTSEDGTAWSSFLRGLVARGLAGVELVTSDAHEGLKAAIAAVLPGTSWQRCRTHFMRNLLSRVPRSAQALVASFVRTIFTQPDAPTTRRQHAAVVEELRSRFPKAAELLEGAREDLLAFTAFSPIHWRQIWSNNPQERLNREIRRRTDVVGIFPDREALVRLVGAVLAEQHDEWAVARRYMSLEYLAKALSGEADDAAMTSPLALAS